MAETATVKEPGTVLTGALAIVTGIASLGLLAMHPGGQAQDFAGVLQEEAANRVKDALVHGGFIIVLTVQLTCYAILSRRIGFPRPLVMAGLVFFAAGAAFLCGSMVIDGLVTPAIAAKYATVPAKADFAKSLFVMSGALVAALMPLGLFFQSIGVALWGLSLLRKPSPSRAAGILGVTIGAVVVGGLIETVGAMDPIVLMGGIAALALWAFAVGVLLCGRTGWSA
jgi:hypothetical protein